MFPAAALPWSLKFESPRSCLTLFIKYSVIQFKTEVTSVCDVRDVRTTGRPTARSAFALSGKM